MSEYPKIYLAIDNCIFYKRWTSPEEWSRVIKELGVNYIEASADTELDPLYMGSEYFADWVNEVRKAEKKYGVKVCNLYSGHGSYTTLGAAHPDKRVRDNLVENFIFPLVETAGKLGCGMGFFAHAFPNFVLQSKETYDEYVDILINEMAKISRHASESGCKKIGLERMYTPHQYPWRNDDIGYLLREVKKRSGCDFYFTEDVGHHNPKFIKPTREKIIEAKNGGVWLGSDRTFELFDSGADVDEIMSDIEKHPQLFTEKIDCDFYETIRRYGCYSPIIHLQQTNGCVSSHLPFTPAENEKGLVKGDLILKAIKDSYDRAEEQGMPVRCDEIYLTLELFSGTTSIMHDVLRDAKISVDYWRQFIPTDGITLDELLNRL